MNSDAYVYGLLFIARARKGAAKRSGLNISYDVIFTAV